jgi:hypothetical protein
MPSPRARQIDTRRAWLAPVAKPITVAAQRRSKTAASLARASDHESKACFAWVTAQTLSEGSVRWTLVEHGTAAPMLAARLSAR